MSDAGPERLRARIAALEAERHALRTELQQVQETCARLRNDLEHAIAALEAVRADPAQEDARFEALRRRAQDAADVAVTAQEQLAQERAWVAQQVGAIASSQSWRLGHRLMRTARAVTFRRDEGTDALTLVIRQLADDRSDEGAP